PGVRTFGLFRFPGLCAVANYRMLQKYSSYFAPHSFLPQGNLRYISNEMETTIQETKLFYCKYGRLFWQFNLFETELYPCQTIAEEGKMFTLNCPGFYQFVFLSLCAWYVE